MTTSLPVIDAKPRLRAPAATWLCAAVAGICLDRFNGPPVSVWWGLLISGLGLAIISRRNAGLSAASLLLGWAAVFGVWHHAWWWAPDTGHVYRWSTDEGVLLTLQGRVIEPAWTRQRPGREAEAIWLMACEGVLVEGDRWQAAPGTLRVQCDDPALTSQASTLLAGDRLRLTGRLVRPAVAGNPGGFDYRQWLRTQGVEALFRVRQAGAITRLPASISLGAQLANWRHRLRSGAVRQLHEATDATTASVGEALLLGTRSQMPQDVREAFAASGMLHMLAISGVNVAVIWWGLIRFCRLLGLSLRDSSWTVIAGLVGYAWLTDANPPIVRAVTFAIVFQLAELLGRRVSGVQGMCLAAGLVLARNPTDLFNPGAWLSFLSVAVLASVNRWCDGPVAWWRERITTEGSNHSGAFEHLRTLWRWCGEWLLRASVSTGAVWLATAPLVAFRFHLVSFAGILLNLLVAPLFVVLLWLGYAWLMTLAISPLLSEALLWPFTHLLKLLLLASEWGSRWAHGHTYLSGLPGWWIAGFYLGMLVTLAAPAWWTLVLRLKSLLVWLNLGLAWGLLPLGMSGLVCDVVAVGHGLAIVIQGPAGRTLVYDAGSLSGDEIAAEGVSLALWQSRQEQIDAAIVSHADADHCNGLPRLARRFRAGALLFHPTFAEKQSLTVADVRDTWRAVGGRELSLAGGDRLQWDPEVDISVWQPSRDERYGRDNSNSLVIRIEYAQRQILLTGDLEREGLVDLLRRPRSPVDILIAPHHGSLSANTSELGAWTHPGWVAVSTADRSLIDKLRERYPPDTALLSTANSGRLRFQIYPDGTLDVRTFH